MKHLKSYFFAFFFFCIGSQLEAQAKWTIMIYVQADSILNNFAIKNFNAMASVGSNENLNIITQWNQPRKRGSWRYKINKNKMELIHTQETPHKINYTQSLIDFAEFTTKNYPAENYIFIFWNHGVGIIDPEWHSLQQFSVNPAVLSCNPRICIDGITKGFEIHRGILFDIPNRNYLDNQGLTAAFSHITRNILHKKFALVGMDACLMAMFEVFYQIKEFAHYSVASEEVELAQGWSYAPFLHSLAHTDISTEDLAKTIVTTFEDFYKNKTQFYTQSAVNLENISYLKNNIDQLVANIQLSETHHPTAIKQAIKQARNKSFQLSTSCYIDLYSFYSELQKQLLILEQQSIETTQSLMLARSLPANSIEKLTYSQAFQELKETIEEGKKIINHTVIANVASPCLSRSKGLSIYYPQHTIDKSYLKTEFAQDSLWLNFLQKTNALSCPY